MHSQPGFGYCSGKDVSQVSLSGCSVVDGDFLTISASQTRKSGLIVSENPPKGYISLPLEIHGISSGPQGLLISIPGFHEEPNHGGVGTLDVHEMFACWSPRERQMCCFFLRIQGLYREYSG